MIPSKGRYAITALAELAMHSPELPLTLADLTKHQGISQSYLEQLFRLFREAGLVRGTRGPGGGYYLNRPASEIFVADILAAVNPKEPREVNIRNTETRKSWDELTDALEVMLLERVASISLADLTR